MSTDIELPGPPPAVPAVSQGTIVEQSRAVAEVAAAVRVARDFPRSADEAREEMRAVCGRLKVAERAFYAVPNRGSGLSVHIARELARIYRNVDYGVRELHRDDEAGVSEMQAWAWDVENNVRSTRSFIQPHARMKDRRRVALTDLSDIYLNNQNTAARAVRECIFTILPGDLLAEAETVLTATLEHGEGKPLSERQTDAVATFKELGITQQQLESKIGAPLKGWTAKDIGTLTRIYQTVQIDNIPIGDFFPEDVVTV